jgi:hypothetical protein
VADFIHISNLIQGEVLRIRERRTPEQRPELLQELIEFLQGEITTVSIERLKATEELSEG